MKFFQKRWVAIIICMLMICSALAIGRAKEQKPQPDIYDPSNLSSAESWAKEQYASYLRYVSDDAGLLSQRTIRTLSQQNAAFDYLYDSICGLGIVNGLDGADMEDAAFDMGYELGLGESDFFLLLDVQSEEWYFVYGEEAAEYADHTLELLVTDTMGNVFEDADRAVPALYEGLEDWYSETVPGSGNVGLRGSAGNSGMVVGGVMIFVLLIVVLVVTSVISALIRTGRRVVRRTTGFWPLFFTGHRHYSDPFRTTHRSGSGPNHGSGYRPGGPRTGSSGGGTHHGSGGFGSSSRGNFSRGGGFGGSRRGDGGFGGKR